MTARLTVHCAGDIALAPDEDFGDDGATLLGVVLRAVTEDDEDAPLQDAAPLLRGAAGLIGEPVRIVPADAVLLTEATSVWSGWIVPPSRRSPAPTPARRARCRAT